MRNKIFNSPFELGLRSLILLSSSNKSISLERLIYYDYIILHSSDFDGPKSLHPAMPFRNSEILVKRDILQKSIKALYKKNLIDIEFLKNGIHFRKSKKTPLFLNYLNSDYSSKLRERAAWVNKKFGRKSDPSLKKIIDSEIKNFGAEFHSPKQMTLI